MSDSPNAPTEAIQTTQDPLIQSVLGGRYRILARIGVGGMGAVYQVEHILMKKVMALKLLRTDIGQQEDAARRFEREAQSASRLSHPNIIQVTDFGQSEGGELYLVMEYLAGKTLAEVMTQEGRMEPGRACQLAKQILLALEHAHTQGVVHRDLKPANVMLIPNTDPQQPETVKILDFGIAKLTQSSDADEPLTKGVMIVGTPSYMSPEQAAGDEADLRSDLYSCGIILYEMLTGAKPFVADDLVKILRMQITAPPPRFSVVAPTVRFSPGLESVVLQVLAKDRAKRFSSAAEFREALTRSHTDRTAFGAQIAQISARVGLAAGSKLWSCFAMAWKGLRFVGHGVGRLNRGLDGRAFPLLRRLPWRIRPIVIPGLVILALAFVVILTQWPVDRGPAPTQAPPKPKPVAPEMRSPLKKIEEVMSKGHLTEARVLIMQQISSHPEMGRIRYLLGNLEFADKNPVAGLDAYEEALRRDPGLRADAAMLVNLRSLLQDKRLGLTALQMMIQQIGKPACDYLVDLASDDRRVEFRQPAREAVIRLSCPKLFDAVASYSLDLIQGRTCDDRREAVLALGKTGDARAIEPLRKARKVRGGIFGGLIGGAGNGCIVKDINAALKELGAPPETPPKKSRSR